MSFLNMLLDLHPEPIPTYKFKVYMQLMCLGFSKITNIVRAVETEPLNEGGVNDRVYSLVRPCTQEKTLVMERGVAERGIVTKLLSSQFNVGRRISSDVYITVHRRDGSVGKIFEVHGAVVKKVSFGPLDSMSGQVLIQTYELSYETIEECDISAALIGGAERLLGINPFL